MSGAIHVPSTTVVSNQETLLQMSGAQQPLFGQGNTIGAGTLGAAVNRNVITTASLAHATATVQGWAERIQTNRNIPSILNDLTAEEKQSVKEQLKEMSLKFSKLDQLIPLFYALTSNRDATVRLILMKFMLQDQLESLKREQYTITPENLMKLKERLQHYYTWVKSEMPSNASSVTPGNTNNLGPINGAMAGQSAGGALNLGTGTLSVVSAGASLPSGVNTINPGLMAAVSASITPNQSAPLTSNPVPAVAPSPPAVTGTANMMVKQGLTPADLKLPPPKKASGSPPISAFPVSAGVDVGMSSTTNTALQQETSKAAQATLSIVSSVPSDQSNLSGSRPLGGTSPTPMATKALDVSNLTSSQLLMAQRPRHVQLLQQQQQQQGTPQNLPLHLQETQQSTPQPLQQVQVQPSPHQQLLSSQPIPIGVITPVTNLAKPLESLSKEDLIQQHKTFQQTPASKQSPAVKLQLHKIQAELAKQHRQEQAPRLGVGLIPSGGTLPTSPGLSMAASSTSTIGNVSINTVQQASQLRHLPVTHTDHMPQIKDLQMQDPKAIPAPQPSEPLEFLTQAYKTLSRVDDAGNVNDETVTHESAFMLHNAFEGFVGKRVGNGLGKDMYDESSRKRSRTDLGDDMVIEMLLCNAEGRSNPFMASFMDWGQEIQASE